LLSGGEKALAGFVFQAVYASALRVGWIEPPAVGAESADALLSATTDDDVVGFEAHDVDVAIAGPHQRVIQVKFSPTKKTTITAPALSKIIKDLATRAMNVFPEGESSIGLVLATNRALTGPAQRIVDAVPEEVAKQGLDAETLSRFTLEKIDPAQCVESVRHFANTIGCIDDFEERLANAAGGFLGQAAILGKRIVGHDDLAAAFTGHRSAKSLVALDARWRVMNYLPEPRTPASEFVDREFVTRLNSAVRSGALVALVGRGGTGKTATLLHWMRTQVRAGEPVYPFIFFEEARAIGPNPVGQAVVNWWGVSPGHAESADRAMLRLETANPGTSPLVLMGLDDLDDSRSHDSSGTSYEAITWFTKQGSQGLGRKCIVVTLRPNMSAATLLPVDAEGEREAVTVEVDNFSNSELLLAATKCSRDVGEMIRAAVSRGEFGRRPATDHEVTTLAEAPIGARSASEFSGKSISVLASAPLPNADLDVLSMLKHPVIWSAFTQQPVGVQESALTGEASGLSRLCRAYIGRFAKGALRHERQTLVTADYVLSSLAAVAKRSVICGCEEHDYGECWVPAMAAYGSNFANALFAEAWSAGVIDRIVDRSDEAEPGEIESCIRWCWNHGLIASWLAGGLKLP
jgi:hypothetical protein